MPDPKRLSRIMKALGNEVRLSLYLEIAKNQEADFEDERGCLVGDIKRLFKIGAPTISHHLKELVNAGLITTDKRGKFLVAKINEQAIDEVEEVFTQVRGR